MQLTPLQSRLAASLGASLLVLALYFILLSPHVAFAAEASIDRLSQAFHSEEIEADWEISYEPEFSPFDRALIGRAPSEATALENNEPQTLNLSPGSTICYVFRKATASSTDGNQATRRSDYTVGEGYSGERQETERDDFEADLKARATSTNRTVYISANTCLQPGYTGPKDKATAPPQLSLLLTSSSTIGCPDGSKTQSGVKAVDFVGGAVTYSVETQQDVYITLAAPNITDQFKGVYNYEVAASVDDYYHRYDNSTAQLLWLDSDSSSALLSTRNLTSNTDEKEKLLKQDPPFELFVDHDKDVAIGALRRSACGLRQNSFIRNPNKMIQTSLTTSGVGQLPKQQFYLVDLNTTATYSGILVKKSMSNDTNKRSGEVGGGDIVYEATLFSTTSSTNCRLITDLEFCTEIQYAVPGNNDKFDNIELAKLYDDYARQMYANFEKVMMQIQCEAPPTQQYSLARNCNDCRTAYKNWLCTVSMPRCEDITSSNNFTIPRNIGQRPANGEDLPAAMKANFTNNPAYNASRNKFIDEKIKPGPYKEILPCKDICYEVVQSCPAKIGFTCPLPHSPSFSSSYGHRNLFGLLSCNYPGEARTRISKAVQNQPEGILLLVVTLSALTFLWS